MDSVLALYWAARQGHGVNTLLTLEGFSPGNGFRQVGPRVAESAARSLRLSWTPIRLNGDPQSEALELSRVLSDLRRVHGLEGIVAGYRSHSAAASKLSFICQTNGLALLLPLEGLPAPKVLWTLLEKGYSVLPMQVRSNNGARDLLGNELDNGQLNRVRGLSSDAFPILSTIVTGGPGFGQKIRVREPNPVWNGEWGELQIAGVDLVSK